MPKIVRFHETGPAEVLELENLPLTEPGEGEVRLKVEAIGLNRADVMFRQGQYLQSPELPSRLGYEAAGIVDAVGPGTASSVSWPAVQLRWIERPLLKRSFVNVRKRPKADIKIIAAYGIIGLPGCRAPRGRIQISLPSQKVCSRHC